MNRIIVLSAVVALVFGWTGCASTQSSGKKPGYLKTLQTKQVDPSTYTRIYHGRVLQYADILNLVKKGVPDDKIVSYLKSTKAPYRLSNVQITALLNAGAGPTLVNYLGKSTGFYDATTPDQTGGSVRPWSNYWKHPYYTDPYFMGPAPFGWDYPGDWFGPGFFIY